MTVCGSDNMDLQLFICYQLISQLWRHNIFYVTNIARWIWCLLQEIL